MSDFGKTPAERTLAEALQRLIQHARLAAHEGRPLSEGACEEAEAALRRSASGLTSGPSPEMLALAEQALASLKAREGEDIQEWAARLAASFSPALPEQERERLMSQAARIRHTAPPASPEDIARMARDMAAYDPIDAAVVRISPSSWTRSWTRQDLVDLVWARDALGRAAETDSSGLLAGAVRRLSERIEELRQHLGPDASG